MTILMANLGDSFHMLVYIYKSPKREDMYIYLSKKDNFSVLPEALLGLFGQPQLALFFDIDKKNALARVDISQVKKALQEEGFFLQLPPKPENLLTHQDAFFS